MAQHKLSINGKSYTVDAAEDMPLLWVIRDFIGLTGTKYGCGIGQCGSCTVHLDGMPVRACSVPVSAVAEKKITTIEGLSEKGDHPVQEAWVAGQVPQCGYCQSGQIMTAVAFLRDNPNPSDQEIEQAMEGHLCRCGTYQRVRKAVRHAAELQQRKG